jgi:hypothetical protein
VMKRGAAGGVPGVEQFRFGCHHLLCFLGIAGADGAEEGEGLGVDRPGRRALGNLDVPVRALLNP